MDIDFKNNGYRFLVRCSALITNEEISKVILFKVKGRNSYMLPGGRLSYQENSLEAIKREMIEELGINSDYKLICIEENFLKNKNIQSIEFIYYTKIDNIENIRSLENKNQEFDIVNINDIENFDLKPNSLKEVIKLKNINNIIHNINYE